MIGLLLAKDLRRAYRNPLPWLINLLVPLAMTALIGLTFGGRSNDGAIGRIRFAVVDEDKTPLADMLRAVADHRQASRYLEPIFLDRQAALKALMEDKLSAVLIIPEHFTRNYLTCQQVSFELIKNPAQSVYPAVLEELLAVVATGMNALARNFRHEFPEVLAVLEGHGDYQRIADLIRRAGDRLKTIRHYVDPPLIGYNRQVRADGHRTGASRQGPGFNMFGFLLVGLTGMFLLFIAGNGMIDLHRELRYRTLARYHTIRHRLLPMVAAKVIFAVVLVLVASAIMLGGGSVIFRFGWQHPVALAILTLAYAFFAAGLMAMLTAVVTEERLANALANMVGIAIGMAGGCAFPPQNLPSFLRDHVAPYMPTHWFSDTIRGLEWGQPDAPWFLACLKLAGVSILLIAAASWLFRRRFRRGALG